MSVVSLQNLSWSPHLTITGGLRLFGSTSIGPRRMRISDSRTLAAARTTQPGRHLSHPVGTWTTGSAAEEPIQFCGECLAVDLTGKNGNNVALPPNEQSHRQAGFLQSNSKATCC